MRAPAAPPGRPVSAGAAAPSGGLGPAAGRRPSRDRFWGPSARLCRLSGPGPRPPTLCPARTQPRRPVPERTCWPSPTRLPPPPPTPETSASSRRWPSGLPGTESGSPGWIRTAGSPARVAPPFRRWGVSDGPRRPAGSWGPWWPSRGSGRWARGGSRWPPTARPRSAQARSPTQVCRVRRRAV